MLSAVVAQRDQRIQDLMDELAEVQAQRQDAQGDRA